MKFLLALDNFSLRTGGATASARELADALLASGHRVEVLQAGRRTCSEVLDGIPVRTVRLHGPLMPSDRDVRTLLLRPRWRREVFAAIVAGGPSLVITQGMLAPGTIEAAQTAGVPVAYFFRGYAPLCPAEYVGIDPDGCTRPHCARCLSWGKLLSLPISRGALRLYDRTIPTADLVVANSRYIAGLLERFWGVRAEVVPPTLRLSVAARPENDPDGYLLFVKPQVAKGLEIILDLAAACPERTFAVAGTVRGRAMRRLGSMSNVRMLGWRSDMQAVYREARLLLLPSKLPEPFGRVAAEAAAFGCPTLAYRVGGISEAAGPGALLLDRSADIEDWKRALDELDNPSRFEPLRLGAIENAGRLASEAAGHPAVELLERAARREITTSPLQPLSSSAKKLKVVHVISALPLGGAELSVFHLASRLSREHFETRVICTREEGTLAGQFRAAGVPVELVRLPSRYSPFGLWSLARRMQEFGADIVHTHMRRANTSGRIAAWLARVPVIVAHERNLPRDKKWRHFLADRVLANMSSKVIAVSQQVAEAEVRGGGTPLAKLLTIPNALDLIAFRPSDRTVARRALGLTGGDFVVGFAGRLHPVKNVHVLLRAVAEAAGEIPNLRLALAGDGPERGRLESLAGDLRIAPRTLFLGTRQDMPAVYPAFDMLCLPSQSEGCSRVLLEAAACGLPLVATPVGYAPELLGEEEAGVLVPVGDPSATARAIVRLARDPEMRSRMGRTALEHATAHGIDDYVHGLERLYIRLWAERAGKNGAR